MFSWYDSGHNITSHLQLPACCPIFLSPPRNFFRYPCEVDTSALTSSCGDRGDAERALQTSVVPLSCLGTDVTYSMAVMLCRPLA